MRGPSRNPDKVSCLYAENPVMQSLMFPNIALLDNLGPLAKAGVPVLHVCGSLDPALADNSNAVESSISRSAGRSG